MVWHEIGYKEDKEMIVPDLLLWGEEAGTLPVKCYVGHLFKISVFSVSSSRIFFKGKWNMYAIL